MDKILKVNEKTMYAILRDKKLENTTTLQVAIKYWSAPSMCHNFMRLHGTSSVFCKLQTTRDQHFVFSMANRAMKKMLN